MRPQLQIRTALLLYHHTIISMKLNDAGLILITRYEGFRANPYRDVAGVPTIGYGTTVYSSGTRVTTKDRPITRDQALQYKMHDLAKFSKQLDLVLTTPLSENRYSALLSFVYNLGIGTLKKSTLLKCVNDAPGMPGIRTEFMKYIKARNPKTGLLEVWQGLVKRRAAEADLYFG